MFSSINSISDIVSTQANSTLLFNFDLAILKYSKLHNINSAVIVNNIKQIIYKPYEFDEDSSLLFSKENIYNKEKHYSELAFHYWYWKNKLDINNENWIGFCQRRRFIYLYL